MEIPGARRRQARVGGVASPRRQGRSGVASHVRCDDDAAGELLALLPEYAKGRKAIWTAINPHTGRRRIDEAFPVEFRDNTNDHEMFIRFKNGSTWQVVGSDAVTTGSGIGSSTAGIVFSEWALANPSAWAYHRPMLEENNGWAVFITTPRGRNHAHAMYNHAQRLRIGSASC